MDWYTVVCPSCGRLVEVPAPSDWDLSPVVECRCGEEIKG